MRNHFVIAAAASLLSMLLVVCCVAETGIEKTDGTASAAAPLKAAGAAEKPKVAALGKPAKPKFALKMTGGGGAGADAPDRAAEVERLIDGFHNVAIGYVNRLVQAATPEEKEEVAQRAPSARSVRPFAVLLAHIVAVDPTDEPALDALLFLSKYVGTPEVDAVLAKNASDGSSFDIDPLALILEHHADNAKLADVLKRFPPGEETDQFLFSVFEKTHNPQVRAAAGIPLVRSFQRNEQIDDAARLAEVMAQDRYLDGVPITARPTGPTARDWAEGILREIRTLGIGQVLPEVSGTKLDGSVGQISDYRGDVVLLDVWATWCGPCVAMIPHHTKLAERLRDEPFTILSVSLDAEQETLEEFLQETGMPWEHWWVGTDSELAKTLNIRRYPTIFVLDAQGKIRHKDLRDEQLDEAVDALVAETRAAAQGN